MASQTDLEVRRWMRALDGRIQSALSTVPTTAYGKVTATAPLTVKLDGFTRQVPAYYLDTYTPTVGDRVQLHYFRNEYTVQGKVMGKATPAFVSSGGTGTPAPADGTSSTTMPPTTTSVSPAGGLAHAGTQVTIKGTGFTSPAVVRFVSTAPSTTISQSQLVAESPEGRTVVVIDEETITCLAPTDVSAVSCDVVVTTGAGQTKNTNGKCYFTFTLPIVTGASPAKGASTTATAVTLTGVNFAAGMTIAVFTGHSDATKAATTVVVVSPTELTCILPALYGGGDSNLTVKNAAGQAARAPQYVWYWGTV